MEGLSKTPDEIKKGLEHCMSARCDLLGTCPYEYECNHVDIHVLEREALAYIQQLEAGLAEWGDVCASPGGYEDLARENNELLKKIEQLKSTYGQVSKALCGKENATAEEIIAVFDQVKREREALLEGLKRADLGCEYCKHCNSSVEPDADKCPCNKCRNNSHWEWAGIREATP